MNTDCPNYKIEIHKLKGFNFTKKHQNVKQNHFVICVHNFLSFQDSMNYQKNMRKLSEKDLMKHGNRRHALYFDVAESGLDKRIYRYGQKNWPMSNKIPEIVKDKLLYKIANEFGIFINGIVYNVYTSKKSHIWWHTDLQPGIGDAICTFSTGRTAYLEFRAMHNSVLRGKELEKQKEEQKLNDEQEQEQELKENECILRVPCHNGTLLIMSPGVNEFYQHRVSVPTEYELNVAINVHGCIDRENTTMHFHFDENKYDRYLNIDPNGGLATILKNLL